MRKRKTKPSDDPRCQTQPGHYLKNAPWREDFVEQFDGPAFSARDTAVLLFLVAASVTVAATLWLNPPRMLRFESDTRVSAQAQMAGKRLPLPYRDGLAYDSTKFEEVTDDDPMLDDDLDDVLTDDTSGGIPVQSL